MRTKSGALAAGVVLVARAATFEVASVKPSARPVGPDYNNQVTMSASRFVGHNVTLRRLLAEAHGVQMSQVAGPRWLDENEYEVEARTGGEVDRTILRSMLTALLTERFHVREHIEQRPMPAYELRTDKSGPKFSSKSGNRKASDGGFPFHGDMRHLADVIAAQMTISIPADPTRPGIAGGPRPVVQDKTGLEGIYDFAIDIRPEPGADMFTLWRRFAEEQLGLKLEKGRGPVDIVVIDGAERIPEPN